MRARFRLTLALALLSLAPTLAQAQSYAIDKGSMLIGGTAGFSSTGGDSSDDRYNNLLINPSVHYFVTPGLAFGGEVTLQHVSRGDSDNTAYGIGPGVMYFFGSEERSVYPYAGANIQVLRSEGDTALGFGASVGGIMMLMDAVGLDGSLYYQKTNADGFGSDVFGLAVGIAAFVF